MDTENVLKMFSAFEKQLANPIIQESSGSYELEKLKKENEATLCNLVALNDQIRTLRASLIYIKNLEVNNNNAPPCESTRSKRKKSHDSSLVEKAEVVSSLLREVVQMVEDEDVVHNALSKKQSKNKKVKKADKSNSKARILTRRMKKETGLKLINPRKFYQCLICRKNNRIFMEYKESSLKTHYRNSHGIPILGNEPLPTELSQLEEPVQVDQQQSTKCHICNTQFRDLDILREHKSLHVNPKFCRYKCERCPEAFVLEGQLQNHLMVCQE